MYTLGMDALCAHMLCARERDENARVKQIFD